MIAAPRRYAFDVFQVQKAEEQQAFVSCLPVLPRHVQHKKGSPRPCLADNLSKSRAMSSSVAQLSSPDSDNILKSNVKDESRLRCKQT